MNIKEKNEHLILTSEDYIRPLCGCDIANGVIKYCSKHRAASDMYEALKGILLVAIPHDKTDSMVFEKEYFGKFDVLGNRLEKAVEALAKAEEECKEQ